MSAENQILFNIVIVIAGFFVTLWVRSVKDNHDELKRDFKAHRDETVREGVRRVDFDRAVDDLKAMLGQLFERLDRKADK